MPYLWRTKKRNIAVRPEYFVFCERASGAPRFHIQADSDGDIPEEEAASLLAMHCLVRGHSPRDYVVMVKAGDQAVEGVTARANRLLERGRATLSRRKLSRREQEVLAGISRNQSNKEIAASLHLSESTVKFHVSALLTKFSVPDRVSLMLEAQRELPGNGFGIAIADAQAQHNIAAQREAQLRDDEIAAPRAAAAGSGRVLRLPRRNASA